MSPSQTEVSDEICSVLQREGITPTAQDLYFVYPSTPMNPDTSRGAYCGWHSDGICNGKRFLVAYVGTPSGTNRICSNPSLALDCASRSADTNLITRTSLHELFETITNGLYPTWVDDQGKEIADKCGPYVACLTLGGEVFVVEPEYSNELHGCAAVP